MYKKVIKSHKTACRKEVVPPILISFLAAYLTDLFVKVIARWFVVVVFIVHITEDKSHSIVCTKK